MSNEILDVLDLQNYKQATEEWLRRRHTRYNTAKGEVPRVISIKAEDVFSQAFVKAKESITISPVSIANNVTKNIKECNALDILRAEVLEELRGITAAITTFPGRAPLYKAIDHSSHLLIEEACKKGEVQFFKPEELYKHHATNYKYPEKFLEYLLSVADWQTAIYIYGVFSIMELAHCHIEEEDCEHRNSGRAIQVRNIIRGYTEGDRDYKKLYTIVNLLKELNNENEDSAAHFTASRIRADALTSRITLEVEDEDEELSEQMGFDNGLISDMWNRVMEHVDVTEPQDRAIMPPSQVTHYEMEKTMGLTTAERTVARSGPFMSKSMTKALLGDMRIFEKEKRRDKKFLIAFLLDMSGSMSGIWPLAYEVMNNVCTIATRAGAKTMAIGYGHSGYTTKASIITFKDFDDLGLRKVARGFGGNADSIAIEYSAVKGLHREQEDGERYEKMIVVFSDEQPCGQIGPFVDGHMLTQTAALRAESRGFKVLAVTFPISAGSPLGDARKDMYRNRLIIDEFSKEEYGAMYSGTSASISNPLCMSVGAAISDEMVRLMQT